MVRHLTFALLPLFFLVSCSQLQNQDDFRLRWSQLEEEGYNQADVEAEVRFGREVAARFLGARDGVDNRTLQTYVNTVGQYVAQYSGRDDIEFFFWVIEDEVINAYAMPGGYIFLTSKALSLMENEAQLAGVLAHEIAHVTERHIVKALDIQGASAGSTLTQLTSGANDAFRVALGQAADQAVSLLTESGLQHQDEYDADELGVLIMVQAGYEPEAYYQYLERVGAAQASALAEMSNTHPFMDDRLSRLDVVQKENGLQNLNYAVKEERFKRYLP